MESDCQQFSAKLFFLIALDILIQPRRNAKVTKRFFRSTGCNVWRTACRDHGQAAQLRQADQGHNAARRPSGAQGSQQQDRRGTPADAKTGQDDGPVQVTAPGAPISRRPRSNQYDLSSPPLLPFPSLLPPRQSQRIQALGSLYCRTIGLIARYHAYSSPREIIWQCRFRSAPPSG